MKLPAVEVLGSVLCLTWLPWKSRCELAAYLGRDS
jgi:hypothetical protein